MIVMMEWDTPDGSKQNKLLTLDLTVTSEKPEEFWWVGEELIEALYWAADKRVGVRVMEEA